MKYGKTILFLMIAVFLFSIATVNATEVNDTSIASDHILSIESTQENTFEDDGINEILADNPKTFTQLDKDMDESGDTFEIMYDYTFNNESDCVEVIIEKSNFIINGNNHTLEYSPLWETM